MSVESPNNANELNVLWPLDADFISEGAAHFRMLKGVVKAMRGLNITSVSAAKTFALTDANNAFLHPASDTTARTWTIPANASVEFPVGTVLVFINDTSAGVLSIAITTDAMVQFGTGSTGTRTLAASGYAFVVKMTTTRWGILGAGLT